MDSTTNQINATVSAVEETTEQTEQTEQIQTEVTSIEVPSTETPQTETPQSEAPQAETPQTEAPQTETPVENSGDQESSDDSNTNDEPDVPTVKLTVNIPTSGDFKTARKEYLTLQKENEEKRKDMAQAELSQAQLAMIEEAFKNRDPSASEVRVLIDGEKNVFNKDVEEAILAREYNIEYVLDKKHPGKTVAYIQPPASNPMSMLSALVEMGLLSPQDLFGMLLGGGSPSMSLGFGPSGSPFGPSGSPFGPSGSPFGPSSFLSMLGGGAGGDDDDDDEDEDNKPSSGNEQLSDSASNKAPCKWCGKVHN